MAWIVMPCMFDAGGGYLCQSLAHDRARDRWTLPLPRPRVWFPGDCGRGSRLLERAARHHQPPHAVRYTGGQRAPRVCHLLRAATSTCRVEPRGTRAALKQWVMLVHLTFKLIICIRVDLRISEVQYIVTNFSHF